MPTEIWVRNPDNYIKECVEVGITHLAWDYGILKKKSIDPDRFAQLYYGASLPWRALIIREQGAVEIDQDHNMDNPSAVYPVWEYGQPIELLERYVTDQANTLERMRADKMCPDKPLDGQEHRVVIIRMPSGSTSPGRAFLRVLSQFQDEYPECIIHVHGLYSFRLMFALSFRSVDIEPRNLAQKGKVVLPSGKEMAFEYTSNEDQWVNLLGFKTVDLKIPRNRCMFNIRSALWAGEHFKEAVKFRTRGFTHVDPDDPMKKLPQSRSIMVHRVNPQEGDKFLCNLCSLQTACKYFRDGAVCIVPDSEPVELARFFKTRDADSIIDGLGTLLAAESSRLTKALAAEQEKEELYPETTKIINTLFDRGVKLAKLVDPRLAAAGAPRISVTQINGATPQGLVSSITEQFVAMGIPRSDITPDMVMKLLNEQTDLKQKAIEVAAVEKSA